jgi:hypothetical protein
MQCHVVTLKLTDVSEVRTASSIFALMMEAAHTSETLVNFNMTIWDFILATITQSS